MKHQPTLESYVPIPIHSTPMAVTIGPLTVWFSYKFPVAFKSGNQEIVVHKPIWNRVTEKHIDAIDGGTEASIARRVDADRFGQLWDEQVVPILDLIGPDVRKPRRRRERQPT